MPERNFANRTLFHGDNLPFLRGMNSGAVNLIATERALQRHLSRLRGDSANIGLESFDNSLELDAFLDGTGNVDRLDDISDIAAAPFFDDEQSQIADLLKVAGMVKADDHKLEHFLTEIVDPLHQQTRFCWCSLNIVPHRII